MLHPLWLTLCRKDSDFWQVDYCIYKHIIKESDVYSTMVNVLYQLIHFRSQFTGILRQQTLYENNSLSHHVVTFHFLKQIFQLKSYPLPKIYHHTKPHTQRSTARFSHITISHNVHVGSFDHRKLKVWKL
jgi:hypothetical protein